MYVLIQVNKAHRLFQSALFSPGLYTVAIYDNSTITNAAGYVSPDTGIEEYYPSFAFGDDLFWASTWLYRAATNNIRRFNISYYNEAMEATMELAYAALVPLPRDFLCVCAQCSVLAQALKNDEDMNPSAIITTCAEYCILRVL